MNAKSKAADQKATPAAARRWRRKVRFVNGDNCGTKLGPMIATAPQLQITRLSTRRLAISKLADAFRYRDVTTGCTSSSPADEKKALQNDTKAIFVEFCRTRDTMWHLVRFSAAFVADS